MTAKPWLVICSCGWERECSSEWAAQSITKLHPQFASMDVAHVTRVEGPGDTSIGHQFTQATQNTRDPGATTRPVGTSTSAPMTRRSKVPRTVHNPEGIAP